MHAQFSNFSPTGGALDNEEVYASASETNYRNQGIARLLQSFGRIYFDPAEAIDHPSTQMGYLNSRSLGVGLAFSPRPDSKLSAEQSLKQSMLPLFGRKAFGVFVFAASDVVRFHES